MFIVKSIENRELVNGTTQETFIKQTVNIVESKGCLGIGSGKSLWLNAPENTFKKVGQVIDATFAQIQEDYRVFQDVTKSGHTIWKVEPK